LPAAESGPAGSGPAARDGSILEEAL
jgi:hypothetical protein